MSDPVVTRAEQALGFASAKADLDKAVPAMFRGYIHDDMIAYITFNVLAAAMPAIESRIRAELAAKASDTTPKPLAIASKPVVPTKDSA